MRAREPERAGPIVLTLVPDGAQGAANVSGELRGRSQGGSGSRAIGSEAPHRPLGGFAGLIADDQTPDRVADRVALHAGGRGSLRRSRRRETSPAGTRTGGLRGAKRETGVGPWACLLSADTEHGRSFFPRQIQAGAFGMPFDKALKFLHLAKRQSGPNGRFGRFPDEGDRCRG